MSGKLRPLALVALSSLTSEVHLLRLGRFRAMPLHAATR
jgi:hypothetical protein